MHDLLQHAYRNGYAIGTFEPLNLDFLEAIADPCFRPIAQDRVSIDFVAVSHVATQHAYSNTDAIASPVFSQ